MKAYLRVNLDRNFWTEVTLPRPTKFVLVMCSKEAHRHSLEKDLVVAATIPIWILTPRLDLVRIHTILTSPLDLVRIHTILTSPLDLALVPTFRSDQSDLALVPTFRSDPSDLALVPTFLSDHLWSLSVLCSVVFLVDRRNPPWRRSWKHWRNSDLMRLTCFWRESQSPKILTTYLNKLDWGINKGIQRSLKGWKRKSRMLKRTKRGERPWMKTDG